ncbi:glycosyltransferase family 2 protein [Paenibacillus xylaniclasticus]|uniref:glycosyltransferase family 2 protein n=1 Tax=Paenibacillus xylaniclasticus TaxID=588083 RepID=UPI000FD9D53E|nr:MULTISPECIES: glycosyltransferase family 2 protein [Paenibacillus]GFN33085.1 glycosyl transferase [Paenibacillus curdlanolyticus]
MESSKRRKFYLSIKTKFIISHAAAIIWTILSIYLSLPWVMDLGQFVTVSVSAAIIAGIAYVPGYMNAFMVVSLLLDRQPPLAVELPDDPLTILIACRNEEKSIGSTLAYVRKQNYAGPLHIIVIDNGSSDRTADAAVEAGEQLGLRVDVMRVERPGKHYALNEALKRVETPLIVTLDADTLLHPYALSHIVARYHTSPDTVCAVAGAVLVRNSRYNLVTRVQEWDYFLGIASIKRLQGLFQGTLVAQGAFSLYKTDAVRAIGGWPDAIGEDIVLTWRMLGNGWNVYFEPLSVAFTDVPNTLKHFVRQRSRWARGMIEALKLIKPWSQPIPFVKYLTGVNLVMPFIDSVYTFCWLPGLIMAMFGYYWVAGPMTLLVLPLAMLQNYILYRYQKKVFRSLQLRIRKNRFAFVLYVLFYQMIMSPVSVLGYLQETFKLKRVWK